MERKIGKREFLFIALPALFIAGCQELTLEDNQKTAIAERTARPTPKPGPTSIVIGAYEETENARQDTEMVVSSTPTVTATPNPSGTPYPPAGTMSPEILKLKQEYKTDYFVTSGKIGLGCLVLSALLYLRWRIKNRNKPAQTGLHKVTPVRVDVDPKNPGPPNTPYKAVRTQVNQATGERETVIGHASKFSSLENAHSEMNKQTQRATQKEQLSNPVKPKKSYSGDPDLDKPIDLSKAGRP